MGQCCNSVDRTSGGQTIVCGDQRGIESNKNTEVRNKNSSSDGAAMALGGGQTGGTGILMLDESVETLRGHQSQNIDFEVGQQLYRMSIEPLVAMVRNPFEDYQQSFEKLGQSGDRFILRHRTDPSKDLNVTMNLDEGGRKVEWDDLPRSLKFNIEQNYDLLTTYPLEMLNCALQEQLLRYRDYRPNTEISELIEQTIDIKTTDPGLDWHKLNKLDEGGFGEIFKVQRRRDNEIFAMKQISNVQPDEVTAVINEAKLNHYLSSNCNELIGCQDLYFFQNTVFIILELMDQGSMTKICMQNFQNYSEEFCRYSLFKVLLGLKKMHDNNVLHRDIKSDNILHSKSGDIKIADLGFAKWLSAEQHKRQTTKGTPNWISPEMAREESYGEKVDIWSYGCFAYELATGMPPFADIRDRFQLYESIRNIDVPLIDANRWSPDFQDFVRLCLIRDHNERPTASKLLRTKFLINLQNPANLQNCKAVWQQDLISFINNSAQKSNACNIQ